MTFVFLPTPPTGTAGSEQDKYSGRDNEPLCNSMHGFFANKALLQIVISMIVKALK